MTTETTLNFTGDVDAVVAQVVKRLEGNSGVINGLLKRLAGPPGSHLWDLKTGLSTAVVCGSTKVTFVPTNMPPGFQAYKIIDNTPKLFENMGQEDEKPLTVADFCEFIRCVLTHIKSGTERKYI